MVAWIDLVVHALDDSVLVDEETDAFRPLRVRVGAGAICDPESAIDVA